jgi:transcriptional regulator of arginine metabolism
MRKAFRQAQILKLVRGRSISTQEELAEKLAAAGIDASQVTLSRDIRELGLIKTAAGYREQDAAEPEANRDSLRRVLQEFLRDIRLAQNLVVLKTAPGGAQPIARGLDREDWPETVGTVAGDDTIFIAAANAASAKRLRRKLLDLW